MKRRVLALLVCAALALTLGGCGRQTAAGGEKRITLTVVHGDKSQADIPVTSAKETLGEALTEGGIIAGEEGPYGLYVRTVDGETADESREQWWCLTKGGQSVNTGVDSTPFANGDTFEFTLMEGY